MGKEAEWRDGKDLRSDRATNGHKSGNVLIQRSEIVAAQIVEIRKIGATLTECAGLAELDVKTMQRLYSRDLAMSELEFRLTLRRELYDQAINQHNAAVLLKLAASCGVLRETAQEIVHTLKIDDGDIDARLLALDRRNEKLLNIINHDNVPHASINHDAI